MRTTSPLNALPIFICWEFRLFENCKETLTEFFSSLFYLVTDFSRVNPASWQKCHHISCRFGQIWSNINHKISKANKYVNKTIICKSTKCNAHVDSFFYILQVSLIYSLEQCLLKVTKFYKRLTTSTISQLLIDEYTTTVDFILKNHVLRLWVLFVSNAPSKKNSTDNEKLFHISLHITNTRTISNRKKLISFQTKPQ